MSEKETADQAVVAGENSSDDASSDASDSASNVTIRSRVMARGPWFTVGVLTTASAFAFLDRQILALLIEPVRADLDLTDTQISILIGFAFVIFHALFALPIGRWVDSGPRRLIVVWGIAMWSLCTAACGLARSFFGLFVGRVGVGVGEAALGPAATSMIADLFPPERRGFAVAVFVTGSAIGAGFATVIAAVVFDALEGYGRIELPLVGVVQPWQVVFFVVGLPGLLVAGLALLMREPRRGDHQAGGVPIAEVWQHIRGQAGLLVPLIIGFSLLAVKSYGIASWIPTFLIRTHGWTVGEAGIYFGLTLTITAVCGALMGGRLADWLGKRGMADAKIVIAIVGNLLTLVPIVIFPLVSDGVTAMVFIGTYYVTAAATTPMGVAIMQEITPPRMRGQLSAVFGFFGVLVGMGLGPLSIALITDYVFENPADLRYSLAIVPVFTVTGALILLMRARAKLKLLPELF
jgi:MFS family permease